MYKSHGIACLSFLLIFINTLIWGFPIICLGVLKFIPIYPLKKICHYLDTCANGWIKCNALSQNILTDFTLTVVNQPDFDSKQWYTMVIANHQSWVDIFILQRFFHQKIPFLKFFLKKRATVYPFYWFGVVGAFDFPFMTRYSAKKLKKNPQLRLKKFYGGNKRL